MITGLYINNSIILLITAIILSCISFFVRKEHLYAFIIGLLITLCIINFGNDTKYGPLEKDIGIPFDATLLVTQTKYSAKNKIVVCEIQNRDNNKVYAYLYGDTLPEVNDVISVKDLKLKSPADSAPEFLYFDKYLKSLGIRYTAFISEKKYSIIASDQGDFPFKQARQINKFISSKIEDTFKNKRTSAFLQGLLLGNKDNFAAEDYDAFKISGCAHIVSVSGFHVMLLLSILGVLLSTLPYYLRDILKVLFLILLVLITGCSPSVIRASAMVILAMLASYLIEDSDTTNFLCIIAIMLILNNRYIIHNASFLLSFTATYGILACSSYFNQVLNCIPKIIRKPFVATVSAQIGVFPAMMALFGTMSVYSVIPNIIISLIVPCLFVLAPITLVFSLKPLIFMCDLICEILHKICHFFASLPYSTISFECNQASILLMTFSIFLICNLFVRLKIKKIQDSLKE